VHPAVAKSALDRHRSGRPPLFLPSALRLEQTLTLDLGAARFKFLDCALRQRVKRRTPQYGERFFVLARLEQGLSLLRNSLRLCITLALRQPLTLEPCFFPGALLLGNALSRLVFAATRFLLMTSLLRLTSGLLSLFFLPRQPFDLGGTALLFTQPCRFPFGVASRLLTRALGVNALLLECLASLLDALSQCAVFG
jgi:hypothetical protein